jgi:hypothetical protein
MTALLFSGLDENPDDSIRATLFRLLVGEIEAVGVAMND